MRAENFEPIDPKVAARFLELSKIAPFPKLVGLRAEEVRKEYARMRLPYRSELNQPAGIVHGGAIATLIDTVVVGVVFSNLSKMPRRIVTIDMHVHYMDAAIEEDLIAEATTRKRGRSTIFMAVDVTSESGKDIAHGELCYRLVF